MPKITKDGGPSVAGLTTAPPTEAEYTDAMGRHGTDKWTEDDARVEGAWLAERRRQLAAVDPHAEVPEVAAVAAEDASAKASDGPDAKGETDRAFEGTQTSEERVQRGAELREARDKGEDDSNDGDGDPDAPLGTAAATPDDVPDARSGSQGAKATTSRRSGSSK